MTYRAVVIRGLVHNDGPNAEEMWMGPGSFWTQPSGAVHITSANAADNIAYVEIDSGPYLVWPPAQATATDEAPINVDASNLVRQAPHPSPSASRTFGAILAATNLARVS